MCTGLDRQNELSLSFSRWLADGLWRSLKKIDTEKVELQEASDLFELAGL